MRASEFVFHSDVNPSPPGKCLFVHHSAGTRHPQPRVEPGSALQSSGTCGDLYGCAQPLCMGVHSLYACVFGCAQPVYTRVWVCTACAHTRMSVHSLACTAYVPMCLSVHSLCTCVYGCAQHV